MMQHRMLNDIYQLTEVSWAKAVNPGLISTGSQTTQTIACVFGGPQGTIPAQFALGDTLEVVPGAGASPVAGLQILALPTATPGTVAITFYNFTGGAITPLSATYTIIAHRVTPTVI